MSYSRHLTRSRLLTRSADVFTPLALVARGLRRHAAWLLARWRGAPRDRRGPALVLAAAAVAGLALIPYGPLLAISALLGSAAWAGRGAGRSGTPEAEARRLKLQGVYAALTPYLSHPEDPRPLYSHDGDHLAAFPVWEFDQDGRLSVLELLYPPYFRDTEAPARARVEQVLRSKAGRSREYRFLWDEESNRLRVEAPTPLPDDIAVQRFVAAPGETVLGFTDSAGSNRMIPVQGDGVSTHRPPVLWRTGPHSSEPHLLALGAPGAGISTLLRAIAVQALAHGDLVVIDGAGTGEHACLAGRPGVHTVETGLHGALAALEWVSHETERRLSALNRARHSGGTPPEDATRPLWLLLDRPTELSEPARAEGRPDPQDLLDTALRHGRAARITVVVGDHLDAAERIRPVLRSSARARVVLGAQTLEQAESALGSTLDITPGAHPPIGRGFARIGSARPVRLQVPAAPDPLDEDAPARLRAAVVALLPRPDVRPESPVPARTAVTDLTKPPAAVRPQPSL
jgi:hypothetical protein